MPPLSWRRDDDAKAPRREAASRSVASESRSAIFSSSSSSAAAWRLTTSPLSTRVASGGAVGAEAGDEPSVVREVVRVADPDRAAPT